MNLLRYPGFITRPPWAAGPQVLTALTVASGFTTFTYAPSGGLVFSGVAPVSKDKVFQPAGGLVFGGVALVLKGKAFLPSGGLNFGGTALAVKGKVFVVSGGIVFGGGGVYTWSGAVVPTGVNTINSPVNVGTLLNRS